jgi:hypothetical protein
MSDGKTNEDIQADHDAFRAAYLRARVQLGAIPGVLGVGYGHVNTGGEFRVRLGFLAFVREKKAEALLPPNERIPRTFEGYRVDVRVAQPLEKHENNPYYGVNYDTREPVIMGGIQIEPRKKSKAPEGPCEAVGTLGCLVKRRRKGKGDDNLYLLSNRHVLWAEGCGQGDYVYQPYASKSTDKNPGVLLGKIDFANFEEEVKFGHFFPYIDCAIAKFDVGSSCSGSTCSESRVKYSHTIKGLGPDTMPAPAFKDMITDVRDVCGDTTVFVEVPRDSNGQVTADDVALRAALVTATPTNKVRKVGRTSGRTVGVIVGVNVVGFQNPGNTMTIYHDLIEIMIDPTFQGSSTVLQGQNRIGERAFASQGDSGSIVVDKDNKASGLVFGGPPRAQRQNTDYLVTWACHIVPVLDALDVCIVTKGGTAHGSDGAKDGSGLIANLDVDPNQPPGLVLAGADAAVAVAEPDLAEAGKRVREIQVGRELGDMLTAHQREISFIVRNSRAGKSAWHRLEGPAFFAQTINHLRGESPHMPAEIRGVRRATLLARLRTVLMTEGSYSLQRALEEHGDALLALGDAETLDDCLDILQRLDTEEPA